METLYRTVKVSDRLPEKEGFYLIRFQEEGKEYTLEYLFKPDADKEDLLEYGIYWLEEIEIPTDEEVLKASSSLRYACNHRDGSIGVFKNGVNWLKQKLLK